MAMAACRRAAPQISGIANRLAGFGHCQKKSNLPMLPDQHEDIQMLWRIMLGLPTDRVKNTNMVLLGQPGAGKGTYGSLISKLLKIPHISTGDLIRSELKKQSPTSSRLSEMVSQGKLIDDDTVFELLGQRLENGCENGFILDGFPRTVHQAEVLDKVTDIHVALNVNLDREALIKKCLGRRVCGECGKVYSLVDVSVNGKRMPAIMPPKECVPNLVIRKDDNEESVRKRLEVYDSESKPVEDYYRKQGKLVDFHVCGSVDENVPRLIKALNLEDYVGKEGIVGDLKEPARSSSRCKMMC